MTASITDFTQFAALRHGADKGDTAALREVAGQFEALFLQTMLKTMRDASIGDPLFGESEGHEMYQGMLDQQLALEMSSGKGMGLAEMLVRQLGGADGAKTSEMAASRMRGTAPVAIPGAEVAGPALRASPIMAPQSGGIRENGFQVTGAQSTGSRELDSHWKDPESFARDVWPHAQRVAKRLNVPAEAVMAQAALETGWGRHVMPGNGGSNSNNLFGIKAGGDWSGSTVSRQTIEFEDGIARQEVARFRAYDDVASTFDDYFQFLTSNPRYAAVRDQGEDIDGFAGALAAGGYATDPAYAEKISRVATSETMNRVLAPLKNGSATPIQD
jgi:flagellar protein FlgJ